MATVEHGARGGREHGAAAVEFALVAPLLLALMYGIVSFGLVFYQQITVTQLARQAARTAAICAGSPGATDTTCNQDAQTAFDGSSAFGATLAPVTVSQCAGSTTASVKATVSVIPTLYAPGVGTIEGVSSTPCGG